MTTTLQATTIEANVKAKACIILLHGLGASGDDFAPLTPQLQVLDDCPLRFILPDAPVRPVTINGGLSMPAWYDLYGFGFGVQEDEAGIRNSAQAVEQLIAAQEADGIPSENIVLAGFSQGGAIALHAGLRYAKPLAGILALSTYLPLVDKVAAERHVSNQRTPIFMAQGLRDDIVLPAWSEYSKDTLESLGYAVQCHSYDMTHTLVPAEINDIVVCLRQWLAN